jgi:hypothetical protein
MIRVRILRPTTVRLTFAPGDELLTTTMTPELRQFLDGRRVDGECVAEVVTEQDEAPRVVADEDEVAVAPVHVETTMLRGRRSSRTAH